MPACLPACLVACFFLLAEKCSLSLLLARQDMTGESGTYIYMAPEVIRHEQYGPSVDVYSWGILLWELVHNETPYDSMHLTAVQVCGWLAGWPERERERDLILSALSLSTVFFFLLRLPPRA